MIHHKYYKNGALVTMLYSSLYTVFLHYIKNDTGYFVYGYLEKFDDTTRLMYFVGTGIFTYTMYKMGQFLTYAIHGNKPTSEGVRSTGAQKKKHK